MSRPRNQGFWIVTALAAASGVAIAILVERGIVHSNTVFRVVGVLGALYFLSGVVIIPYLKLKMFQGGFRLYTQSVTSEIRWDCVTEVSVYKEDGALEWWIKTRHGDNVFICNDEYLYRSRLRKGAISYLNGFNEAVLQTAINSPDGGAWTCFKVA